MCYLDYARILDCFRYVIICYLLEIYYCSWLKLLESIHWLSCLNNPWAWVRACRAGYAFAWLECSSCGAIYRAWCPVIRLTCVLVKSLLIISTRWRGSIYGDPGLICSIATVTGRALKMTGINVGINSMEIKIGRIWLRNRANQKKLTLPRTL